MNITFLIIELIAVYKTTRFTAHAQDLKLRSNTTDDGMDFVCL